MFFKGAMFYKLILQWNLMISSSKSIIIPRRGIRNSENKRKQDQPSLSLSNLDPSLHLIDQQRKVGVTSVTNNHSLSFPETVYVYIGSQGKQRLKALRIIPLVMHRIACMPSIFSTPHKTWVLILLSMPDWYFIKVSQQISL